MLTVFLILQNKINFILSIPITLIMSFISTKISDPIGIFIADLFIPEDTNDNIIIGAIISFLLYIIFMHQLTIGLLKII